MKKIDQNSYLIRKIGDLSAWLSKQRGLPIVIGIIFIAGGGVLEFVNIFYNNSFVSMIEVAFHHFGLITALVGIVLLEPLGT